MLAFLFNIRRLTIAFLLCVLTSNSSSDIFFDPARAFQQDFYVQSNLEFTLLHELAHAVIELNDIPILGGQEQAADQIALMLLMMADDFNKKDINPDLLNKLLAISGEWMLVWEEEKHSPPVYWDTHPLAIQRFYEVTCLAYGSNPDKLEALRRDKILPVERAWDCDIEFEKTRQALAWLATKVTDFKFNKTWDLVRVKDSKGLFPGRINVVWIKPNSEEQKQIYRTLKSFTSLAEVLKRINSLLNLKTDITIYMEPFCRAPGAWWDGNKHSITVCYGLIKGFEKNVLLLPDLVKQLKSSE
ncbi:conserved hypothetical protein [Oleispira antarctica RB-8]|uniref:Metallopeptidase n=1 Tax=Oleispira antarctica RB-8 TaxID=698738 RepID=R4YLD9_OLEAN|nr:conserved hypothetical protein [Oleispira antarctica RB-8]|tara:strand:+ start:1655 stop:2557 length:903 start_codon:yes stop_codon:yes gene_type:complete